MPTLQRSAQSFAIQARNYAWVIALLMGSWVFSRFSHVFILQGMTMAGEQGLVLHIFFEIIIIFIFGFLAYEAAKPTIIPSFVLAIFIGMLERENFLAITGNSATLTLLTTLGAIFILFGGGLETPFRRFRELLWPILSLSFLGMLITGALFSVVYSAIGSMVGVAIPLAAAVLLGAALASTDPAAIIPSIKPLIFRKPRIKHVAISETAITDVVGPVLTGTFLVLFASQHVPGSIVQAYAALATPHALVELLKELVVGLLVGLGGYGILHAWNTWKADATESGEADAALFIAVPILCYTVAAAAGGSGFLAVFIAGLLFQIEEHFQHVEHYFTHTIEGFAKPLIFMLLGASVDIGQLISTAGIGIATAFAFMFLIRPIAVFLSLLPFAASKNRFSFRELLFLSFVRETGVIAAVLVISLGLTGLPGMDSAVAVGLWVILLTLIVEPPLTPLVARTLGIVNIAPPFPAATHAGSTVILCSRGESYKERLPSVVDWAEKHGIRNIALLHCPEGKYTKAYIGKIEREAQKIFEAINTKRKQVDQKLIRFEFLGHPGLLQDNVEQLVKERDISAVFIGTKMLDYRLQDVKRLRVPFVFLP